MGGYDVFYSKKRADGTWGEPVNMGYPINTTDNDLFFQALDNGKIAYYSIYSPRGMGLHDIYRMDIYSDENPRTYEVAGTLRTEDGRMDSWKQDSFVTDNESGDTVETTITLLPVSEPVVKPSKVTDTTTVVEHSPQVDSTTPAEPEIEAPVEQGTQLEEKGKQLGWLFPLIILTALGFFIWWILWMRRRKKKANQQA
jgi:hypothetical protein